MFKNSVLFSCLIVLIFSCGDKVQPFNGFTQKEMEFLLASDESKAWLRISKEEDGEIIEPDDCGMDNYLVFVPGSLGDPKPLLYAYNPLICDSLEFCMQHPDFCQSNATLCESDPDFCELLAEGVLYIGSWYAKAPFIENSRSDTLIFEINNKKESIFVTHITSQYATFQYKQRTGANGGLITENYNYSPPE
ncbi:MAG: hypothetical protein MI975_10035 [Cytophagales bacterium]|nr:hypothetical protein [Cytophagales bacterium]